ncbi:LAO/AO transport system kinase [Micromonospora pallida]|uniref:LAO/AO transport system kinase n=1 Tax=Micromonospora pallida TaxID=145854 RepID=A0A1C6RS61_9ACTN|nr:methylmalonyl Co-A mutase-associated GTPase MeaB [Micromonospora pallida]SCL20046.1 LAO/AO transport system kinase [Micromonospora pallida]
MARARQPKTDADVAALLDAVTTGTPWVVGRLLSLAEDPASARVLARALSTAAEGRAPPAEGATPAAEGGGPHVVGITGPPGVGKSSIVSALLRAMRRDGLRVAVLAVDPSSPYSGGALLGDRTRMREHATDPNVFIRSLSSQGQLGGLSRAAPLALRVLGVAGFDVIIIETVGVGQSEVDVADAADTVVVALAPGAGDELQAAKAGVLEIADIFVVNKADLPDAARVVRQLRRTASLNGTDTAPAGWRPMVVRTVASADDVAELRAAVAAHRTHLDRSGSRARRRAQRTAAAVRAAALHRCDELLRGDDAGVVAELAGRVGRGELDVYAAADLLVARLSTSFR